MKRLKKKWIIFLTYEGRQRKRKDRSCLPEGEVEGR